MPESSLTAPYDSPVSEAPPTQREFSNEVLRKILHMSPGLLPFALAFVDHPDPLEALALIVVTGIICTLTGIYLLLKSRVSRTNETDFYLTALSYPAIVLATLLLFPARAEFTMVVVIILALGDGSAFIGGKLFGRAKLPWNAKKSWAGTFSFVLVSAPLATLAFWLESRNPEVSWTFAAFCAGSAAITASLAESLPVKLSDNLRVGLAAVCTVVVAFHAATAMGL